MEYFHTPRQPNIICLGGTWKPLLIVDHNTLESIVDPSRPVKKMMYEFSNHDMLIKKH